MFESDYVAYNFGNGPKCKIIKNTTTNKYEIIHVALGTFSNVIPGDKVEMLPSQIADAENK
jgi:hypothetical protein